MKTSKNQLSMVVKFLILPLFILSACSKKKEYVEEYHLNTKSPKKSKYFLVVFFRFVLILFLYLLYPKYEYHIINDVAFLAMFLFSLLEILLFYIRRPGDYR